MLKLLGKCSLTLFLALLSLNSTCSLTAQEPCYYSSEESNYYSSYEDNYYPSYESNSYQCIDNFCQPACEINHRFYIGAFGGGLFSNSTQISQEGTAFFTEAVGGPLAVYARGNSKSTSNGFGGALIGYELSQGKVMGCSNWALVPAGELEAFFYRQHKKGDLINPTDRLPEHDFVNSFDLNTSVILVNAALSLNNTCGGNFSPYIAGGLGAARFSLKNAKSIQIDPPEEGINHYNSKRHDSAWTFAAQAKAGVRYKVFDKFHIFAEYRYLFLDSSKYVLGSTVYPTHAPTSPWNVKVDNVQYNSFAIGILFDL